MEIVFNIDQKAAIRHGLNAPHSQESVNVDPSTLSPEQRELLSQLLTPAQGLKPARATDLRTYEGVSVQLWLLEPTVEQVQTALQAALAQVATKLAERQQKIDAEKADYRAVLKAIDGGGWFQAGTIPPVVAEGIVRHDRLVPPNYSRDDTEARQLYEIAKQKERDARDSVIRAADAALSRDDRVLRGRLLSCFSAADQEEMCPNAARFAREEREEREAAEQAEKERHAAELRALIAEHGTPDQLERYDAGVLPVEERERLVKDVVFAPFSEFARYVPLTEGDIGHDDDCYEPAPKFSSDEATELDADQWRKLQAIRKAAPDDAVVQARRSIAWCGFCSDSTELQEKDAVRWWVRVRRSFAGEEYKLSLAL